MNYSKSNAFQLQLGISMSSTFLRERVISNCQLFNPLHKQNRKVSNAAYKMKEQPLASKISALNPAIKRKS